MILWDVEVVRITRGAGEKSIATYVAVVIETPKDWSSNELVMLSEDGDVLHSLQQLDYPSFGDIWVCVAGESVINDVATPVGWKMKPHGQTDPAVQ